MRTSARATAMPTESARLLGVLDERLAGRDWVMGADYSIADISLLRWCAT
jgi:GSH-dependent disulfide-bond oxidoreductase